MNELPKASLDGVEIAISSDRMTVTLNIQHGAEASSSDIIAQLRALKIARFDDGMVIEAIEHSKKGNKSLEVANGVAPVDDRPGRVEYRVPFAISSPSPTKVEVEQVIANVTPGSMGTDGIDVFGQLIERRKSPPSLQIGRNLLEGNGKVICQARGNLQLIENVLSVEPLLEIRGDDGQLAPIVFDGDVAVRGSLDDGRSVEITGCLAVGGALEAVQLNAGGSVMVQGGLIGKQKGRYTIGGDLKCRFISGGIIVVGQDVQVQSDITESSITCGGRLVVDHGVIFGGIIAAIRGLACVTLGNTNGTPTLIEAGNGIAVRSFLVAARTQIEANQKRIQIIRSKIAPLVKVMKALTREQREKATELLFEADDLEMETKKLVADLEIQSRKLNENARAEVAIAKIVHPGVTVRFPDAETIFPTAIKGPLTLTQQKSNGHAQILLTNGTDQSTTILPSTPITMTKSLAA